MDSFEIIMTPDATKDLLELKDYISDNLLAPDTALFYIESIRKKINTLSQMPDRVKPVEIEPWKSIKSWQKTSISTIELIKKINKSTF